MNENAQQVESDETVSTQKCNFTVDKGNDRLNPSSEANKGMRRRRMVDEKSCVTFPLCDTPAGTSDELDVQNKWKENTQRFCYC